MRLILESETGIRVALAAGPLEIEPAEPGLAFSPLHMLAASLATCTLAAIAGWAQAAGVSIDGIEIELAWEYVEDPYRVGRYDMRIRWPGLPESRKSVALRVAKHCSVEHTLQHPPRIETRITG